MSSSSSVGSNSSICLQCVRTINREGEREGGGGTDRNTCKERETQRETEQEWVAEKKKVIEGRK